MIPTTFPVGFWAVVNGGNCWHTTFGSLEYQKKHTQHKNKPPAVISFIEYKKQKLSQIILN